MKKANKKNDLKLLVKPDANKKFGNWEFKWVGTFEKYPKGFVRVKNLKNV